MSKTNFQSVKEITSSLDKKVAKLSKGKLSLAEMEALVEEARELYERLLIIRFKGYESRGTSAEIEESNSELSSSKKEVENEPEASSSEKEEEMMMFDFTADLENEPQNNESEVTETTSPESKDDVDGGQILLDDEPSEFKPNVEHNESDLEDRSLNDNYKKEDSSVAGKFEKAPIADLKEHIGINRKFLYVNELFNGDGNAYNAAIGTLNTCGSKNEAFNHIEQLKTDLKWDEENVTVSGFMEIVERRYL